jgi:hypothetical protein
LHAQNLQHQLFRLGGEVVGLEFVYLVALNDLGEEGIETVEHRNPRVEVASKIPPDVEESQYRGQLLVRGTQDAFDVVGDILGLVSSVSSELMEV